MRRHNPIRMEPSGTSSGPTPIMELEMPAYTDEQYEQFILENGVAVTLTHLPGSEKSAGALSVAVGASSDPPGLEGLAHFTEHAVFLGSEKYPVENAYKVHLSKNGGSSNGGTGMEYTTFHFDVNKGEFEKAADIMSQFFKAPLFTPNAISREIRAVDAEDSKNRILDGRRWLQVFKDLIVPGHPYAKFSTGNVRTLAGGDAEGNAESLTAAMRSFHAKHYRPDRMALSLVGPQDLSELRRIAIEMFGDIPVPEEALFARSSSSLSTEGEGGEERVGQNKGLMVDHTDIHETYDSLHSAPTSLLLEPKARGFPFKKEVLGSVIRLLPLKDIRDMDILWGMPPTKDKYRANPVTLISFLLAHKGPGSIFAALQDLGWATSTSASTRAEFDDFSIFEFSVALTPEGLAHWEEITGLVYTHIQLIRDAPHEKLTEVWQEIKACGELDFQFQEKSTAIEIAPFVSKQMLDYPMHHILSAGWLHDDLDIACVREFAAYMLPELAINFVRSKDFASWLPEDNPNFVSGSTTPSFPPSNTIERREGESTGARGPGPNRWEPYYGVPYHIESMNESLLCSLKEMNSSRASPANCDTFLIQLAGVDIELQLPERNKYVAYELANKGLSGVAASRPLHSSPPRQILDDTVQGASLQSAKTTVWHSKDEAFGQPRTVIKALFHSPLAADAHPVLGLLGSVYNQIMARKLYPSGIAGLRYSAQAGRLGTSFSISGYSPKLHELAAEVASDFGSPSFWSSIDSNMIEICKERSLRSMKSWTKERPDAQCDMLLAYMLQEHSRLPPERIALLESVSTESFVKHATDALRWSRLTMYLHGDQSENDALKVHQLLKDCVGDRLSSEELDSIQDAHGYGYTDIKTRARLLPKGHTVVALPCFNPDDANSALLTHFQAAPHSPASSAALLFLRRMLAEPMFSELRTKRQLGYIVSLGVGSFGTGQKGAMRGLTARILSNRFSPPEMQEALGEFLNKQQEIFDELSQDEVSERAVSLIMSIMDPPTHYNEEASNFWSAILDEQPFDFRDQVIQELRSLQLERVQNCFRDWIAEGRSVSVMLYGSAHVSSLTTESKYLQSTTEPSAEAFQQFTSNPEGSESIVILKSLDTLTVFKNALPFFQLEP